MIMVSDSFRYAESEFNCTSVIHNGVSTENQGGKCPPFSNIGSVVTSVLVNIFHNLSLFSSETTP
jgi:hypothetical protein